MQPLLARIRSLRPARFNSSTGRRRRGGVALAAGVALALIAGSGIAVAAVSSASAHTPAINDDCTGVHVQAWNYTGGLANTVTVTIVGGNPDGSDQVQQRTFGDSFDEKFPFPDSSVGWTYTASIDALDDTDPTDDNNWDYSWSATTVGCAKPDISVTATTCVHSGDLTTVDAVIGTLDPAHAYTVQLVGSNGYDSTPAPIQTTSASWSGLDPGVTYTATLLDTTTGLSATASVDAVGCPQDPAFEVTLQQCTNDAGLNGPDSRFGVTVSGLVSGRSYVLSLINGAGGTPLEDAFVSDGTPHVNSFSTSPSGTYTARITDVADGTFKESNPATFLPCPVQPSVTIVATQCTSTTATSDASLTATADRLVPGRSYTITIRTNGNPDTAYVPTDPNTLTVVYTESLTPATSSSWTKTLSNLPAGIYGVRVVDTTQPNVGFPGSASVVINHCPTLPTVDLTAQQCGLPGGSGSLTATVGNFVLGRHYVVALTQNGLPVAGQPVSQTFDPITRDPGVFSYAALKPGLSYRVIVTDVTVPGGPVSANDITLTDCPGNPKLILTQPTCTVFTTSTITVDVDKLIAGQTYTVSVTTTADGKPVSGVPAQQVAGTTPTASLQFTGVPVGRNYTITVANANNTLSATGTILLTLCDLPTLAYTGASTMTPTLAGLGFLQFGLVLVGISLVRRRSGAREV